MLLFSQAGALAPPRVLARRSSMAVRPYRASELRALAIKMAYCKQCNISLCLSTQTRHHHAYFTREEHRSAHAVRQCALDGK